MGKHFLDSQQKPNDIWLNQRLNHAFNLAELELSEKQKEILILSLKQTIQMAIQPWQDSVFDLQSKLNLLMIKETTQRNNAEN